MAFKAGDYEKALEFYLEASRIDPASPAIYSNCAQAYIKLGNFEAAEDKVPCTLLIFPRGLTLQKKLVF